MSSFHPIHSGSRASAIEGTSINHVSARSGLRIPEAILFIFFSILLFYAIFLPGAESARPRAGRTFLYLALCYGSLFLLERWRPSIFLRYFRDWVVLVWVLVSYRSMDWFAPPVPARRWEAGWLVWDRLLLETWDIRNGIETFGPVIPAVLEIAYALVYGLPAFCLIVIYSHRRRSGVDYFLSVYLAGLYLSYLQFPFWPSEPPWQVFPGDLFPQVNTVFRDFNGWVLRGAGIHTSVFPSAHVSGSVAAAIAMWVLFPGRPVLRWGVAVYAVLVTVATIYCRYHYAVDAAAGVAVGFMGWTFVQVIRRARLQATAA